MSDTYKAWLPKIWDAHDKAVTLKQKRKAVAAAKRVHDSMDDSIELHVPEDGLQAPPVKRKDRPNRRTTRQGRTKKPPRPSNPMILARLCHLVCRWWFDPPGPMAHPGLGGLITIVGTMMIVVTKIIIRDRPDVMGHPDVMGQPDVTRPGAMRIVSRHACRLHREGPAPSPGTALIRQTIHDQHVSRPGQWNPSPLISLLGLRLTTDPCPLSHPGLRLTTGPCLLSHPGHRLTTGPCPLSHPGLVVDCGSLPSQRHSRQPDGDSTDQPGSPQVSRKEIDLKTLSSTSTVPEQPEIQSPVQPASVDDSVGATDLAKVADPAKKAANSARNDDSAMVADPARRADSTRTADSAEVDDHAGTADSAKVAYQAGDTVPAGDSIPVTVTNTASSQDSALYSSEIRLLHRRMEVSFSRPCTDISTRLVCWTLCL